MTDSATLKIKLDCLTNSSRSALGTGYVLRRKMGKTPAYFRKKVLKSPMSGAGLTLRFLQPDDKPNTSPDTLWAALNLPSALVGQNYVHETCARCAIIDGLKLLKTALAKMGIPAAEVRQICLDDVSLDALTLTYCFPYSSREAANALMEKLSKSLWAMRPSSKTDERRTTNRTLFFKLNGFSIRIYNKTNEASIRWQEGAPKDAIRKHGEGLIRLEVVLWGSFLKEHGWDRPDAWAKAAWDGMYREVYDLTVKKAFRLDEPLRQKVPRKTELEKLAKRPNELELVKVYLAGGDPRQHPIISESARPIGAFSAYRLAILDKLKLDIGIAWRQHQEMRHYELRGLLAYPPRYRVDAEVAAWSYCKANASDLSARLNDALEAAINEAELSSPRVRRPILDEDD